MEAVGVESITAPFPDETGIRKAYPKIMEEALNRPVRPAGLLISMTERRLHAEGGLAVHKMQLSDTILGCGQVLTGIAPGTGPKFGKRLAVECRAMQDVRTDKPPEGQAFCNSNLGKATESFDIIKDSRRSTKCRVACNTAREYACTGLLSNNCLERAPDEMDQLQDALAHFRNVESANILDVEKADQLIHTNDKEKHLRRTAWRASPGLPREDDAYTKVTPKA